MAGYESRLEIEFQGRSEHVPYSRRASSRPNLSFTYNNVLLHLARPQVNALVILVHGVSSQYCIPHHSLICAFLYPAYASYKTLSKRPASDAELERWLMYWSVLGVILAVEYVAEWLVRWYVDVPK